MKFRLLLAGLLVPAVLCCEKNPEPTPTPTPEPKPEDKTVTATITANDVTVEEEQTVSIGAITNSSELISYTSADATIATVTAAGAVTGVKAGNTTITLKVPAVEGKFTAAEKTINVTVTAKPLPPEPPVDDLAPEIKDGDRVLATNANVEKFLTDVHYETHDYTFTSLLTWAKENDVAVCPGKSDKPSEYTFRWNDPTAQKVVVTLTEPTREWVYTPTADNSYVVVTNLLPNTHYTFKVEADGGKVLSQGSFDTYGKVHQVYFKNVRNSRDLGGWKTEDGKTVKYRMVYRGGRFDNLAKSGKTAIKTEGLKAELDLRGHSDVDSESTLKGIVDDYEFCAPVIEEGYSQMLNDDKEKTRQCMQFIFDMVDKNKPVYFHCSLGRDRTGTVAMLTLGILGVPEGDISQEYELTQFAPHGYATSDGEKTKMTRIADYDGAANVIWKYAGENGSFQDGVNAYFLEIGLSQADIDKFKQNMLE
ncbi:MAG: tyrosine-protein phosphatase [Bacteroidales bacterium]|nr:tyrosine-protein phosphatase [Bacteroidales bacterium]